MDPVITDLSEAICCQQLGPMESSDHFAILSEFEVLSVREDAITRTIWFWDRADWPSMTQDIGNTDWEALLVGDVNAKARALITKLFALQQQYVPGRKYLSRPGDQHGLDFAAENLPSTNMVLG